jgi:hypothetical protein
VFLSFAHTAAAAAIFFRFDFRGSGCFACPCGDACMCSRRECFTWSCVPRRSRCAADRAYVTSDHGVLRCGDSSSSRGSQSQRQGNWNRRCSHRIS